MNHIYPKSLALVAALALACGLAAPAPAQTTPDVMGLGVVSGGHAKVRLTVTAGPSGTPNGFEVCYMPTSLFTTAYGGVWPPPWGAGEGWVDFIGVPSVHTWGSTTLSYTLAPNQSLDVEIGDTYDETGVSGTWKNELVDGTSYVFCAYAIAPAGGSAGALSVTLDHSTTPEGEHCTYTQGYWKNHTGAWPVTSLVLGTVSYSAAQLELILGQPTGGNGLISLAHQLIATKLNVANGSDPGAIAGTVAAADVLIGGLVVPPVGSGSLTPSATAALTEALDDYNNDSDDQEHCKNSTPARGSTWGRIKSAYR